MVKRAAEWDRRMEAARLALLAAHAAIEALSELAEAETDMSICFASNTLRGSEALLREADSQFRKAASTS